MKKSNLPFKILANICLLFAFIFMASCDTDPIDLGAEFINVSPSGTILQQDYDVKAVNVAVGPVQTDNFNSAVLGRYEDEVYGSKEYSFVSQVGLGFYNPDFGDDFMDPPFVSRVQIEIPYFSQPVGVNGDQTLFELDSVYTSDNASFRLSLYRNQYFINSFDPNDLTRPIVLTNGDKQLIENSVDFSSPIIQLPLIADGAETLVLDENEVIVERRSPRIREDVMVNADGSVPPLVQYFEDLILGDGVDDNLVSAAAFRNYFRGIYFKVDMYNQGNTLFHLDINNAFIELTINTVQEINGQRSSIPSAFRINFNGVRANFIDTDVPASTTAAIAASEADTGSDRMYLNGGSGSVSIIDLFGEDADSNGLPDQFELLRNDQVLINDAYIDFYVDQTAMISGTELPERITLYDPATANPISDYSLAELESNNQINANLVHLSRLEREDSGDLSSAGVKYRIRIADYLARLIELDDEDISNDQLRLAIAVSQNVGSINPNDVVGPTNPLEVNNIQLGTAISHEGVVLHGNLSSQTELRPKLRVFYTPIN